MEKSHEEILLEMVDMHDEYQQAVNVAINTGNYIEATWLCYAIFEQRTSRLIEKVIPHCPIKEKRSKGFVGISTKLNCLTRLRKVPYIGFCDFDEDIFDNIKEWCVKRNALMHSLVDLDKYKEYRYEFRKLAQEGELLTKKYYQQIGDFRKWYYEHKEQLEPFPFEKCCDNRVKTQCIETD